MTFRYYELAAQRAQAMANNALKQIKVHSVPYAVLIAGGFHTPTLTRLFKERRTSYAVIAPITGRVSKADQARYHKILQSTYQPMSGETGQ